MPPASLSVCDAASASTGHNAAACPENGVCRLCRQAMAEFLGTYLLVLFGCGVVHSAVLTGANQGLWQIAIVWGVAIMLAIYLVGAISGAHINPAITVALASRGRFPWRRVPPYVAGASGRGASWPRPRSSSCSDRCWRPRKPRNTLPGEGRAAR